MTPDTLAQHQATLQALAEDMEQDRHDARSHDLMEAGDEEVYDLMVEGLEAAEKLEDVLSRYEHLMCERTNSSPLVPAVPSRTPQSLL